MSKKNPKSKGKKALIVLAVIFAVLALLLLGAYLFVSRALPHRTSARVVRQAFAERPGMYISWQPYEKTDLRLSGEIQTVGTDSFSITLPAAFTQITDADSAENSVYAYMMGDNDDTRVGVIVSVPFFSREEETEYKRLMLEQSILYGYSAKKAFGVSLKDRYSMDLVTNSLDLDNLADDDVYTAYLFTSGIGIMKDMPIGIAAQTIYKIDTPQYNGFIYVYSKDADAEKGTPARTMYVMEVYTPDNRFFPYTVTVPSITGDLSEADVYAIFNSFQVK